MDTCYASCSLPYMHSFIPGHTVCFLKARTSLSERAVHCCGVKHLACVIRLSTSHRQARSLQHPLQGGGPGSEQAWPVKWELGRSRRWLELWGQRRLEMAVNSASPIRWWAQPSKLNFFLQTPGGPAFTRWWQGWEGAVCQWVQPEPPATLWTWISHEGTARHPVEGCPVDIRTAGPGSQVGGPRGLGQRTGACGRTSHHPSTRAWMERSGTGGLGTVGETGLQMGYSTICLCWG